MAGAAGTAAVATGLLGLPVASPAPAAVAATVALHLDEQGPEPVHLLNPAPGPGGLGLPSAHWIRR